MLELDALRKSYGAVLALDGVSFALPPGRMLGFLGPNGAGKTTAMRGIFGLTALDGGQVRGRGQPVGDDERLRFGYMPEQRGLYPRMRVAEQLVYLARLHGRSAADARHRALGWLARLGLEERATDRLEELSHGNQQRVQLAAALVHEPELVVLDEPFSGLDPLAVEVLSEVLRGEVARGAAVLFSSHQLDLVESLCEEVVVIDRGRVALRGAVAELRAAAPRRRVELELAPGASAVLDAGWLDARGIRVLDAAPGRLLLSVPREVELEPLLAPARAAGPVLRFSFHPPSLSEFFVDAVSASPAGAEAAGEPAPPDATLVAVASADADRSRGALLREELDAVVFTDGRLFFRRDSDSELARATQEALRAWLLPARLEALGLDAEAATALATGPPLDIGSLLAPVENEEDRVLVAVGGVVVLLLAITTYGQWVLQGVVEEKTSRVVEVLLVTMRPYQLLAGKVLGIGALGLAQLAVTVSLGLGVASVGGLIELPDRAGALFALELLWFALGFALYAVAYAAAGSLVSRQEEAGNVALPVTLALMVSYFTAVLEDANGVVPRVATFVPLTAPIVIPARAAVGAMSPWEHVAALAIMLAAIVVLVRVAGRIYAGGLLRTGPTARLRDVWRDRERSARP